METCLFCKIARGEIPAKKVYEDDKVIAFYDIDPKAPVHFLVIPKNHISSTDDINVDNSKALAHIFEVIALLSKKLKLNDGYRIVNNCGEAAGQTVKHIHFHVLSGRDFSWPPG